MKLRYLIAAATACGAAFGAFAAPDTPTDDALRESAIDVAPVWSAHPVNFCLLTNGAKQYVAFFDANRSLVLAVRDLPSQQWDFARLPEKTDWDSHKALTLHIDREGYIHLSGNMHASPLVYFRSQKPGDIHSFQRIDHMTGKDEGRTTYPTFFEGPNDKLIFTYRDGTSGNGNQYYNVYSYESRTWHRLLDTPLTDGERKRSTYITGPKRGPDGFFHIVFVWRGQHGAELNHDLSYARSRDLVHWETSAGAPLTLPIRHDTAEIVDPVPVRSGMINGNTMLGFDAAKRPIISYHKYDTAGKTQLYQARRETDGWKIYQTSDWDYRWDFGGFGTIPFEIKLEGVTLTANGELLQKFWHAKFGYCAWTLDPATLMPIRKLSAPPPYPTTLKQLESTFPGMEVRVMNDIGRSDDRNFRYVLRWETLPEHRDHPRQPPFPPASMLRVYRLPVTQL